jgi:hypothetical protein
VCRESSGLVWFEAAALGVAERCSPTADGGGGVREISGETRVAEASWLGFSGAALSSSTRPRFVDGWERRRSRSGWPTMGVGPCGASRPTRPGGGSGAAVGTFVPTSALDDLLGITAACVVGTRSPFCRRAAESDLHQARAESVSVQPHALSAGWRSTLPCPRAEFPSARPPRPRAATVAEVGTTATSRCSDDVGNRRRQRSRGVRRSLKFAVAI